MIWCFFLIHFFTDPHFCRWILFVGFVDLLAELVMVCLDQNSGTVFVSMDRLNRICTTMHHPCSISVQKGHIIKPPFRTVPECTRWSNHIYVGGLIISNATPWWAMQKGSSWHAMLTRGHQRPVQLRSRGCCWDHERSLGKWNQWVSGPENWDDSLSDFIYQPGI